MDKEIQKIIDQKQKRLLPCEKEVSKAEHGEMSINSPKKTPETNKKNMANVIQDLDSNNKLSPKK